MNHDCPTNPTYPSIRRPNETTGQVESGRYGAKVQTSYQLGKKKAFLYGIFTGGVGALSYCAMLTVLWYGGRLVIAGASSVCAWMRG